MLPSSKPEANPIREPSGAEPEQRLRVDEDAVAAVLAHEAAAGRTARQLPHNHPGYDVESFDSDGVLVRVIEVKGTAKGWSERGVMLSATQYEAARAHGAQYWLYVVEHTEGAARVHAIQNPAALIGGYGFDHGWKGVAENRLAPTAGMFVMLDGSAWLIEAVIEGDSLKLLHLRGPAGEQRRTPFRPEMVVCPPEDGEADHG